MTCWLHPKYKGVRRPVVKCGICWIIYNRKEHQRERKRAQEVRKKEQKP